MVCAKAHGIIDGPDIADAFVKRIDRLVDHRQQNAVDDEGREIFGTCRVFAQFLGQFMNGAIGRLVRGNAADQFDQLHQRHRIHEVHAHEFRRAVGIGSQTRHRNGRGVRRNDGFGAQNRTQSLENLFLGFFVLGCGLDHEIAIRQEAVFRTRGNPGEGCCFLLFGDQVFLDLTIHVLANQAKRLVERLCRYVKQSDVVVGKCNHMSNAIAHLTGTDYANGLDIFKRSHLFPTHPQGSKQGQNNVL